MKRKIVRCRQDGGFSSFAWDEVRHLVPDMDVKDEEESTCSSSDISVLPTTDDDAVGQKKI